MSRGQDIFRKLAKVMPTNEEQLQLDKAKVEDLQGKIAKDIEIKDKFLGRKPKNKQQEQCQLPTKQEPEPKRKRAPRSRKQEE